MKIYVYVVSRDFGFAPNPFYGMCTLATCKADIRKSATIGDWIFGRGSKTLGQINSLVYAMQVSKKIDYNQYWSDLKYSIKKPILNGSLKKMYGDNIYYYDEVKEEWFQADSHHSYPNGVKNEFNTKRDTRSKYVLISDTYYYFGRMPIKIPEIFCEYLYIRRGFKIIRDEEVIKHITDWLSMDYQTGYHADPLFFDKFQRYDGK